MDPATFLTELTGRKVYRVAVDYAIVAWLPIQAAPILRGYPPLFFEFFGGSSRTNDQDTSAVSPVSYFI